MAKPIDANPSKHASLPGVKYKLLPKGADPKVYGSTYVAYQGTQQEQVVWIPPCVYQDAIICVAGPYAGDPAFNSHTITVGRTTGRPRVGASSEW